MQRKLILFMLVTFLFLAPTTGLTREYFLYDHERNEILSINDNFKMESIRTIGMTKNPDLIMETGIPDKFLSVFNSRQFGNGQGKTSFQPGQITIYNAKTGRTEELLEIGFTPYQWVYTKERSHFFIAYYSSPQKESVEILHYNFKENKAVKVQGITHEIADLKMTYDEKELLAIVVPVKSPPELITFQITPFQIKSKLEIAPQSKRLYILGPDRAALISQYRKRKDEFGTIKIIDTYGNAVVEERKLSFPNIGIYWYEKSRSLFVTNGILADKLMEGRIYKVTGTGIIQRQISRPWAGFSYLSEQDCLYVLNDTSLTLIDYAKNFSKTFKLNVSNYYPGQYHYYFQRLPSTNLAIVACFEKGYLQFYDLETNQVLKNTTCGRSGTRFLNSLTFKGDLESRTVVTTNPGQSRFYVLNRATRDVTVYDQAFNKLKYLIPEEPPLAMFQVNQPTLRTLVVTAKRLYKIDESDEENVRLTPIADFSLEIAKANYLEERNGSLILFTDRLLMMLEPENLQVKQSFYFYGDPQEKYTKLKNNERRYFFIPEL